MKFIPGSVDVHFRDYLKGSPSQLLDFWGQGSVSPFTYTRSSSSLAWKNILSAKPLSSAKVEIGFHLISNQDRVRAIHQAACLTNLVLVAGAAFIICIIAIAIAGPIEGDISPISINVK